LGGDKPHPYINDGKTQLKTVLAKIKAGTVFIFDWVNWL
jgi:hypothetical protein